MVSVKLKDHKSISWETVSLKWLQIFCYHKYQVIFLDYFLMDHIASPFSKSSTNGFFATDRKMINNFQIWRQKLKIVFEDKKSLGYSFFYPLNKNSSAITSKRAVLCDPPKKYN